MTTWSNIVLLLGLGLLAVDAAAPWWQTASFYQIYPRSFKDSDGDGIGDLNGVTEKLEYLKEIGVTATWLSPFLRSPMADFGYDISDFKDVDPLFGTMDDFEDMVARAKQLNVKIILDFVPNLIGHKVQYDLNIQLLGTSQQIVEILHGTKEWINFIKVLHIIAKVCHG